MSYCLLADAFPNFEKNTSDTQGSISAGCTDVKSAERARKEQKKRAKRCKDPSLKYLEPDYVDTDPDRPALIKQPDVLPMNEKTGVVEARPFGSVKEGFEEKVPHVPGTTQVFKAKRPKYFGSNGADEEEGFAPFTTIIGDDPAYRLGDSKAEKEIQQYIDKITGGELLPSPSLNDVWKPLTPAGAPSSFFEELPPPGGKYPSVSKEEKTELSKKIDDIFARLDQLEAERKQSSQTEILLFVGSGLFLIASMDVLTRKY